VAVGAEQCVGVMLRVYARPGLVAQVYACTHMSILCTFISIYQSICVCTCGGEVFVAVGAEQCVGVLLPVYARPGLVAQVRAYTHISICLSIYLSICVRTG